MRLLSILLILLLHNQARADFLLVQRNGNMRELPDTQSEILERIHTGDTLILLDTEQTNGFYHVQGKQSEQQGWVYRTLVRKLISNEDSENSLSDSGKVVDIRILDVGAGLCALIKLPGNKFVIYDAGSDAKLNGDRTIAQIKDYIPAGSTIELLVLSHTDADHINGASQVIRDYEVKKVLWTGFDKSMVGGEKTGAVKRLINILELRPNTENVNLNALDSTISPGTDFQLGGAKFIFLCGFGKPEADWEGLDMAEKLNGVSIVMKLVYAGNSVLFTGDAVGRHRDDSANALIATEKYLVENAANFLASTIVIAPHHGAKNGSSKAFVDLVCPEWVIFPAGHAHHHPTSRTANLYLKNLTNDRLLRTDRGDDEGLGEWPFGRIKKCVDDYDDDSIQIQLRKNKTFRVYYLNANGECK